MNYELIEFTPKLNKKKVIIAILIAVSIILLLTALIIFNCKKEDKSENEKDVSENNNEVELQLSLKNAGIELFDKSITPRYTEVGRELMKNVYKSNEKIAYLTFDDGPSKTVTPLILDLLKQEGIKATFFVLGSRAELNPDLIRREYSEGHFIANHGYSHVYGKIYSSTTAVLDEYNKTKDIINNILGKQYDGHLFRFPGGSTGGKYKNLKSEAKTLLDENNIAYVDWNALSNDAAGAKTKEAIIDNIKSTVGEKNSVVILMHDAGDKILTYETLPEVISYLREKGYTFKNFYSIMK